MLKSIKKIFSPPVFEDQEKNQSAAYLNVVLWAALILFIALEILQFVGGNPDANITKLTILSISILTVILQFVLRIGPCQNSQRTSSKHRMGHFGYRSWSIYRLV